jgi:Protein kinase domain
LASLLRRIGRLPQDKAIELARKLCAGLGAAHSQGVLHRDLKPANIMIDGRGQLVITDFGLAGLAAEMQNADIRSGTPAYMAPEQLQGKEVSVQSDLYALGLVLYEMFTGKPAFHAATMAEMIRLREQGPPATVSSAVHDIDPAVERVIMRCLEPDPRQRPPSTMAIAAALPGGDPLAAALAAGETPSPEMVAAAGATEGLHPGWALACVAAIAIGLVVVVLCFSQETYIAKMRLEIPPDALAVDAHRIAQQLGYRTPPADRAWSLDYDHSYLSYLDSHHQRDPDWTKIVNERPSPVLFWYRESPRALEPERFSDPGQVSLGDPPPRISGMVSMLLDPAGRLMYFAAVPPELDESAPESKPLDPAPLFNAAGLDFSRFQPAQPEWNPEGNTDSRAAWTGNFPGRPEIPIRVEAASWRGRPVYFQIIGPWTNPARMQAAKVSTSQRTNQLLWTVLFIVMVVAGSLLSWRNLRLGRGDRQGAVRLAMFAFALSLAVWLLGGHHVPWPGEAWQFTNAAGNALLAGAQLWIAYIAVEPFVRRHWPRTIITWTRVLGGGLRDPLVGRDILLGLLVGIGYDLIIAAAGTLEMRQGEPPSRAIAPWALTGFLAFSSHWLNHLVGAVTASFLFLLLLFLLRLLLRKEWLAAIAFVVVFAGIRGPAGEHPLIETAMYTLIYGILVALMLGYGFLAVMVCVFVTDLVANLAFTTDFSAWYGSTSLLTVLSLIAISLFAFRTSTAGKPLFGGLLDR